MRLLRPNTPVVIGRFGAPHGVRGLIKFFAFGESLKAASHYSPWLVKNASGEWEKLDLARAEVAAKHLLVKVKGIDSPEAVRRYTQQEVAVPAECFPKVKPGEYYWQELIGLTVINQQQQTLGQVVELMETGANDVLVIENEAGEERLIPYVMGEHVIEIDEDAAGAYTGLAVIYERSKEYDQAEAYYKKAVSVDSTFTAAKVQYGWFLLTQKRYDDACDMLEEATEDKLADQRHVALYYLGRCEALRANHKGAIDSLGLATRVQRNFAPAWLELGASNYQLGEIEEASYALNQFRRYSADNADSLLLSVKLGLAQGDTDLVHSSSRKLEVHFPESAQWKEIEQLVK